MSTPSEVYLVSGGASGLGEATARALAARGAGVVVADVDEEKGRRLAAELGTRSRFCACDAASEPDVARALDEAAARGELRGAVCCAGIAPARRTVGREGPHDLALFERVVRVNLLGTFNVARLAAAAMARQEPREEGERGVLVLTASIAAWEGQAGQVAYAASKGGVAGMALPMARDLARVGVRVVAIAPGVFDTPMVGAMPDDVRAGLGKLSPYPGRLGRPDEFARLVLHVIENRMLNGCVLRLDGAARLPAQP